jgi:threonine/homoserine/homoserine lactone efflux protein
MAGLGVNLGTYVHLTAAVLGLSAVLAASATAFTAVKLAGAVYLIYLGIRALVSKSGPLSINPEGVTKQDGWVIFWQGFTSDVLNPKVALFFVVLLPQFVNAHAGHPTLQLLLLGLTLNVIGMVFNIGLVLVSARVTRALRRNSGIADRLHNAMGVVFVALGLRLATEKL